MLGNLQQKDLSRFKDRGLTQSWPPASQQKLSRELRLAELSDMITAKGQPLCQFLLEFWQDQPEVCQARQVTFFKWENVFLSHFDQP